MICTLAVEVPPGLPQGEVYQLLVTGEINGLLSDIAITHVSIGLPLRISVTGTHDVVPAKLDALIEIASLDPEPLMVEYFVTDSNGFPVFVDANPSLPPFGMEMGFVHLTIPEDQTLVGVSGDVLLTVFDPMSELEMSTRLPYVIEDPIEVIGTDGPTSPVYTGGPPNMIFPWEFTLRNRCDLELSGELALLSPLSLPVSIPFMLPPGGMEMVISELVVPEDHPAGIEPVQLELMTMQTVGDRLLDLEVQVNTPVTVSLIRRGWSGQNGELVTLQAELKNLRPDQTMMVDYEWFDEQGWLVSDPVGSRQLAPLFSDTLEAEFQLPPLARAFADSDSVAMRISMVYDSGQPATAQGHTWLMLVDDSVGIGDGSPRTPTELSANYPNPFNPRTEIRFNLAEAGPVKLAVHDVAGRQVTVICNQHLTAGVHERTWNGLRDDGAEAASGVYFIRLETRNGEWTRKAVLVR